MVDHAETFWALFGVDLNVLLEQQPPDTWDTFPVFQMLNNYLRNHGQSLLCVFTDSQTCDILVAKRWPKARHCGRCF